MLWNWYTVDSCFIARTWKITSSGMFAGSCIGVMLLVVSLEFLRRSVKEYDRYLVRKHAEYQTGVTASNGAKCPKGNSSMPSVSPSMSIGYRPRVTEQAIRALLHVAQFAVAYFVMLYADNLP